MANTYASPIHSPPDSFISDHADDEQVPSILNWTDTAMEPQIRRGIPQYPGEDTRLTSSKELTGWYFYGWAAEVFVVCGVGSFLPITLEQLARDRGVLASDGITPCSSGLNIRPSPDFNGTISALAAAGDGSGQCIIRFLGRDINTASFALYTFSFSVLVQALTIISMSGAADHGRYRKSLLLTFAITGAIATMMFIFVTSSIYGLGSLLAIVANTCFGASFVLLNSFLPLLVRYHPSLQPTSPPTSPTIVSNGRLADDLLDDEDAAHELFDSTTALLSGDGVPDSTQKSLPSPATASPELQLSTKISSNGIGFGYVAAVIVQILSVFIVYFIGGSTFSLRLVLFLVGAWWFIFTIPAAICLRPRPGPPLASETNGKKQTWIAYLSHAWISLGKTIVRARQLKDVVLFLAAWFLLSDGIATVSGTAILFAKTTLNMKPAALAMINVVVMISGVAGAVGWNSASRLLGLRPSQTILACLCVFEIIPIYALLGYIPAIQRLGVFGLQQPWEMYALGAVYGLVMAGLSSYCRSLFGELIPPGSEAAFYALYAITDKGSSIFGPAIVGAITDATGEIRPAFWFLAALIAIPFPILWLVDVDRGKREGEAMARELDGHKTNEERRYTDESHDSLDEGHSSGAQPIAQ